MRMYIVIPLAAALFVSAGCGSLTRRGGAVPSRDLETLDTTVGERRVANAVTAEIPAPDTTVQVAETKIAVPDVEETPVTVAAVPEEAPVTEDEAVNRSERLAPAPEEVAAVPEVAPTPAPEAAPAPAVKESTAGAIEALPVEETLPEPEAPVETAADYKSVYLSGYRVQLMATTEPDRARDFAESIRPLFGDKVNVYVEYLAPYYKVRVGDCRTRSEAALLLNRARTNGFSESWITATQIIDWTEGNR